MSAAQPTMLAIELLRRDGGTQPRDHINLAVAQDYAEAMTDGDVFPPIVAFYDGTSYWVADGFHRIEAHGLIGAAAVSVDVRQGTQRDAVLYSVGANAAHGYRRTSADKRRAILTLISDPEWSQWSDREIARRCAVSHPTVSALRPKPTLEESTSETVRKYTDRHGNEGTMRVGAIGRSSDRMEDVPPPPVEQTASAELFDHATAARLIKIADAFDQIAGWPSVAEIIAIWTREMIAGPDEQAVVAAASWMSAFAAEWPAAAAERRIRINLALQGA